MASVKRVARGIKAAAKALVVQEPLVYRARRKVIACDHCGGLRFLKRKVALNTQASSLFGTDFLDREACCLVCPTCTRMMLFYDDLRGADE